MSTFKLTIKRGQRAQDVVVAAGSAISGSDALFVNVDFTVLPKGEALILLDEIKKQIHEHPWPQL
ncbi:MAG: hypothetical protein QOG72_2460 [Sphingomonadales bacterium]|jgi:hypothetical protein|nr:hypothetical protein [Sphingomonadales bacterium]